MLRAPWAWFATVASAALFLLPLTIPALGHLLGVATLDATAWQVVGILLGVFFLITEIYKWVRYLLPLATRGTKGR